MKRGLTVIDKQNADQIGNIIQNAFADPEGNKVVGLRDKAVVLEAGELCAFYFCNWLTLILSCFLCSICGIYSVNPLEARIF